MKKSSVFVVGLAMLSFWILGRVFLAQADTFRNGDFSNGWSGWSGELVSADASGLPVFREVQPGDYPDNYAIEGAEETATLTNDDTYWQVSLYQDFDMEPLAGPGYSMDISFYIKWIPSDSTSDILSATMGDASNERDLLADISTDDLLNGVNVMQDVTPWAGKHGVELNFTNTDIDFITGDVIELDDIHFTQHAPSPVPVPASVILFVIGLLGLVGTRKKAGLWR